STRSRRRPTGGLARTSSSPDRSPTTTPGKPTRRGGAHRSRTSGSCRSRPASRLHAEEDVLSHRGLARMWRGLAAAVIVSLGGAVPNAQHGHGSEGVGTAHMETSCARAVQPQFDRALALLHNFWYSRALTAFQEIQQADPECAMAYWGAAMTYNHPLWDEPSRDDEAAAWT